MKRLIDHYLEDWRGDHLRQPLLIRGARQVGKTYAVREFGKKFKHYVEINFELDDAFLAVFEKTIEPAKLITAFELLGKKIIPGETLLFLDEIQLSPRALTSLRYFYEIMPQLHVIAAGSLLDFAIEEVGIPVGRVQSMYMYPLSFLEFLAANGENALVKAIMDHEISETMIEPVHQRILGMIAEYIALGGMPTIVNCWQQTKKALDCARLHARIEDTYRQDFGKYAKVRQIEYLELLFKEAPSQLGKKFKYSVFGDFRKRELDPALRLLETAGIIHKVTATAAQGIPLGSQAELQDFKVIFLDVGLTQAILGYDLAQWFLSPEAEFVNKGYIVEAFVGQELLAYSDPAIKKKLFYWHSLTRTGQSEIDYVIQDKEHLIPVEVKSGTSRSLKSLKVFLETHTHSPYGIHFSSQNYEIRGKVHSWPLYSIAKVVTQNSPVKKYINALVEQ